MGDVVEFPLRVLRLRSTSVALRREASLGRTVRSSTRFGGLTRNPEPRRNPRGRSWLRPRASNRVASSLRLRLRPISKLRGSARSRASARVQAKLVATMLATAPSLVTACRAGPRLRPTSDTAQRHLRLRTVSNRGFGQRPMRRLHLRLEHPASLSSGACPSRHRRLGTLSFGRVFRDRKRSRAIRAQRWLCPANTP
jgi:hypothetical protein